MKNTDKFVFVLFSLLLSSIAHAELKHPTCQIHLANMNSLLKNTTPIDEAKKDRSIIGMIPRRKTIAFLKKYQNVDVNLMLEKAFSEKGFVTSFQSEEEAAKKGHFSIRNYKPKGVNSDFESKDIRANAEHYAQKMSGGFGLLTVTKRKKYYNGFATVLDFTLELKITDPMLLENKTYTFFKYTAEVIIKDGDVYSAFDEAIAEALRGAPKCEII